MNGFKASALRRSLIGLACLALTLAPISSAFADQRWHGGWGNSGGHWSHGGSWGHGGNCWPVAALGAAVVGTAAAVVNTAAAVVAAPFVAVAAAANAPY